MVFKKAEISLIMDRNTRLGKRFDTWTALFLSKDQAVCCLVLSYFIYLVQAHWTHIRYTLYFG